MGLLDEAIREHLDLKRRRGADPEEVERAEREALGPVRRPPEHADADQLDVVDEPQGVIDEPAAEPQLEPETDHSEAFERAAEAEEHYVSSPEPQPEPAPEAEPYESPPSERGVRPAPGPETAEYDVEQEHREQEPREQEHREQEPHEQEHREQEPHEQAQRQPQQPSEDMLEETPDFLQDAPDHDRLWFEQRPPKDFDFEG